MEELSCAALPAEPSVARVDYHEGQSRPEFKDLLMRVGTLRPRIFSIFLPLLLTVVSARAAQAQQPVWPLNGPAFSASPAELQKAAAAVPTEKFAPGEVLYERDTYVLEADGRVGYRQHLVFRIDTQEGVEQWSQVRVHWDPWYENAPEIRARVVTADGRLSQLDQKIITDGPAREDGEDTLTDARIRKAPLPGLAVGAVIEEEIALTDKQPFFAGGGIYRDFFARGIPVVRKELTVEAPTALNLVYRVHNMPAVKLGDETKDGRRRLNFDQSYMAAQANGDIPLATHTLAQPMIEFSTGASWASVAKIYRALVEPQIDPEQVKALLPPASKDRLATMRGIVARLHKEVRYTGVEFGQAALQPQPAAEVLQRHFGDCKDKAALLVAMLRAAGIEAHLALLDAGPGADVTPELAGMNRFDHAIAYVPHAAKNGADLWIDATAEFAEVGTLPPGDQNRLALIIAEGTTGLTATPAPTSDENLLVEERAVRMAEYGAARITETSLTRGPVDQEYRDEFGGAESRETRTSLETYAKNYYLAKALTSATHGDGKDLTQPFALKLEMAEARRGITNIDDASVAIPFSSIFNRLPAWFRTDPRTDGATLTPQQEEDRKRAVAARASEYDLDPFVVEWRYTITPPTGFVLRALPQDKTVPMGPARFTQHYGTRADGVVEATLRFDTVKPTYTVDEAIALREAVLASYRQNMILVLFDQQGAKLVADGKMREGLAADRALIAKHPAEAVHHAQMAYALLKAGMGTLARSEAEKAAALEPNSPVGFRTLAWVCEFNDIGIQRTHGFDRTCVERAFEKAIALDPEDTSLALDLAITEEYSPVGERYGEGARLDQAIRLYRAVRNKDKAAGDPFEDNLLFALLYSRQYQDLLDELGRQPSNNVREAMAIAATVALKGVAAGLDRANHLPSGASQRGAALNSAGSQLLHLRLYREATQILAASAEGQDNAAAIAQQVSVFKNLTPWNGTFFPATDPRSVVQHLTMRVLEGSLDAKAAGELLARRAYGTELEWQRNVEKIEETRGMMHLAAMRAGLPTAVLIDATIGNMKFTSEGSDEKGYRVSVQSLGTKPQTYFVLKEAEGYRVVTDGSPLSEAGNAALSLIDEHREAEAAALLDWMRERVHKGGGDDPLAGPIFPHFWTAGAKHDVASMRLAAAALTIGSQAIRAQIPFLRAAYDKATDEQERAHRGLLLASALWTAEDGAALRPIGKEMIEKSPDSYVALAIVGEAAALLKDWKDWDALLAARLAQHPDDEQLLRMKAQQESEKGTFAGTRAALQQVIDAGKATTNDYNQFAWSALFDGKLTPEVLKAAQQASMLTQNGSFSVLHTLACVYAAAGKTAEAAELLQKAMEADNLIEPNPAIWYGLGSIYEQYGVSDAVIAAYRKVRRPDGRLSPDDTYVLAQMRLRALELPHK
jgi:tetratricopeptide (TPR) repeat protein